MATMNKLRTQMAQQFLDALNQGHLPWKACWQQALPQNAITGKPYHGVNAMNLSFMAEAKGYQDPRWCTYNQAQEKGWQVRKGEKSSLVEYWAYFDKKQKKLLPWAEAHRLLKLDPDYIQNLQLSSRIYFVFNAEQIDGIPEFERPNTDIGQLRAKRDNLIHNMAVGFQEEGIRAFYSPGTDTITLPLEATFDDAYGYMATFLHECAHASGHPCRLNRDLSGLHGSPEYAKEELRAEIASAFAAQAVGLQLTDEQFEYQMKLHSAYLQSWAACLKDAPEELFRAIKAAEEISDYLIEQGDFLREYNEMVYRLDNDFLYIQTSDSGYDYSFYRPYGQGGYYDLSDGGQLDQPALTIEEARDEILKLHDLHPGKIESMDMDEWCDLVKPHGFFAKIVYVSGDSELPSYYDDREKYLQELAYQKSHASPNYGVELTRVGFLKDVSEALLTQGHYMGIGSGLQEDYTAEIRAFMAANPPDVEVHPWMAMENLKVDAVYQWEQRQLALMPEELSIVADGHTGQLFVQPGQRQLMEHRYLTYCCPDAAPQKLTQDQFLAKLGLSSPVDDFMMDKTRLPHGETQRQQDARIQSAQESSSKYHARRQAAISEYKQLVDAGKIIPPTRVEQQLQIAQGNEDNESVQAARRNLAKRGIDWLTGNPISPDPLTMTDQQREQLAADEFEREFWKMNDFLDRGGDIAELADLYEPDLDYGP